MGPEEGIAFINTLPDVDAVAVAPDGKVIYSKGLAPPAVDGGADCLAVRHAQSGQQTRKTFRDSHAIRCSSPRCSIAGPIAAQSTPTQVHTSPQVGARACTPAVSRSTTPRRTNPRPKRTIRKTLERVHAYRRCRRARCRSSTATPARRSPICRSLPAHVALARTDLQILTYEWGVTYAGMLRAAQVTGDPRYTRLHRRARHPRSRRSPRTRSKNLPPGTTRGNFPPSDAWHRACSSIAAAARAR